MALDQDMAAEQGSRPKKLRNVKRRQEDVRKRTVVEKRKEFTSKADAEQVDN